MLHEGDRLEYLRKHNPKHFYKKNSVKTEILTHPKFQLFDHFNNVANNGVNSASTIENEAVVDEEVIFEELDTYVFY